MRSKHNAFTFASIGLAVASGGLSMRAFGAYLDAMRPKKRKKKAKGAKCRG